MEKSERLQKIQKTMGTGVPILLVFIFGLMVWYKFVALPSANLQKGGEWRTFFGTPKTQNQIIELQERVKSADKAALEGDISHSKNDNFQAAVDYGKALWRLPNTPLTRDRKRAYRKQFWRTLQETFNLP